MQAQWFQFLAEKGAVYSAEEELLHFGTPFDNTLAYCQHWQVLNLIGDDAHTFLQGQLTCDIADVAAGIPRLGAHLSLQGRALISFWVLPHPSVENGFRLLTPKTMVEALHTLWEKYLLFSRSTLTVEADALIFSAPATHAKNILATLGLAQDAPIANANGWQHFQQHNHSYFITHSEAALTAWPELEGLGNIGGTLQAQWWDISNGVAHIYPGAENKFLPQAMNYDLLDGISFNKGCYTGQEVVARMKFKGQLRQRLHHLSWPEDIPVSPGLTLRDANGRAVGQVVCAIRQGSNTHALAVLRRDLELPSALEEASIYTHLQTLPYALPEIGQ